MVMKWTKRHPSLLFGLLLLSLVGLVVACSNDSPSEPRQEPPPPPGTGGGGSGNFSVTITVDPGSVEVDSETPVEILIRVRNRSSGAAPANGSTAVVSVTFGTLNAPANAGGVTQGAVTLINGDARVLFFAGSLAGTAVIQAQFQGSAGQALIELLARANFFLSFLEPELGRGGDVATIHGGGFVRPVRVTFGGNIGRVLGVAPNRIRVEVPSAPSPVGPNETLTVSVAVTIRQGTTDAENDTLPNAFSYQAGGTSLPQPVVLSIDPPSGPNTGGTRVTLLGDNFVSPVRVLLGGVEGMVESVTPTRIIARTPSATALGIDNRGQTVDVTVINVESGFEATLPQSFTYEDVAFFIRDVTPRMGPQAGGTQITITGSGFFDPVRVEIGTFVATVLSVTPTQIVAVTPAVTDDIFDTEVCNDNNDEQEGTRLIPTAFDVTATNTQFNDAQDTLTNGFIYKPTDTSCRNDVAPPPPPPPPPVAAFTFQAAGLQVIFDNTSTDFISSSWTFGDGGGSTLNNPTHTYAAAGTYAVTLTVSNSIGQSDSQSQFVTVPPP
jgi:hypothetical protein